MTHPRRTLLLGVIIAVTAAVLYLGRPYMARSSDLDVLRRQLGPSCAALVDDATIAAWQPDPNYRPLKYYAQRRLNEAEFRRLAAAAGLTVSASAEVTEAVWDLPADLRFAGWTAASVPAAAGLQAQGRCGEGAVWMRWYQEQVFIVAEPAAA